MTIVFDFSLASPTPMSDKAPSAASAGLATASPSPTSLSEQSRIDASSLKCSLSERSSTEPAKSPRGYLPIAIGVVEFLDTWIRHLANQALSQSEIGSVSPRSLLQRCRPGRKAFALLLGNNETANLQGSKAWSGFTVSTNSKARASHKSTS